MLKRFLILGGATVKPDFNDPYNITNKDVFLKWISTIGDYTNLGECFQNTKTHFLFLNLHSTTAFHLLGPNQYKESNTYT